MPCRIGDRDPAEIFAGMHDLDGQNAEVGDPEFGFAAGRSSMKIRAPDPEMSAICTAKAAAW